VTREPAIISSAIIAFFIIGGSLFLKRRKDDYRNRSFYRNLYTANIFELILFGWRVLGRTGSYIITRLIALGYAFTHPSTIRSIRANIALLDPARASFAAACRLINQAECFSFYGLLAMKRPEEIMELLGYKEGFDHLQQAHQSGKGCLLVTGHLGFFELGGLVMRELGFPVTALTLPEPTSELTEWRADFRGRWGVKTIVVGDDHFSVVQIVRALNEGAFVASLIDRPYDGTGTEVQLPHGKIFFSTAPVLISLLANCPIIPVGVTRQRDGRYRIEAHEAIHPCWLPEGRKETLEYYTRQIAASLVPMFTEEPEQWYHFSELECGLEKAVASSHGRPILPA
jgi:KDO2-lipid IV(A) lauroyltransferase